MIVLAVAFALAANRRPALWSELGVPNLRFRNSDARTITAAMESRRAGYDPLFDNPADPFHRRFNYPRLWQSLAVFGLGADQTDALVAVFWASFFAACLALLLAGPTWGWAWFLPILISPAVALGLERGNCETLIFAILTAAVLVQARRPDLAAVLVFLDFALKLTPAAAAPVLLRAGGRGRIWFLVCSAAIGLAILAWSHDLAQIRTDTPRTFYDSFGIDCARLEFWPEETHRRLAVALECIVALLPALAWFGRPAGPVERAGPGRAAFLAGALMFCSAYVFLESSYNYRLLFLLLCVPELADGRSRLRRSTRVGVWCLIAVAVWEPRLDGLVQPDVFPIRPLAIGFLERAILYVVLASVLVREFRADVRALFPSKRSALAGELKGA